MQQRDVDVAPKHVASADEDSALLHGENIADDRFREEADVVQRTFTPIEFDAATDPRCELLPNAAAAGGLKEVGMRDGAFIDSMSETIGFSHSGDPQFPDQYISTAAGSLFDESGQIYFDCGQRLSGPEDVHAYYIQLAVGDDYSDLIVRPERRSQAEAIHDKAVEAYHAGSSHQEIYDTVLGTARDLGVDVLDARVCWRG